jgi:hypothetical protein
MTSPDLIDELRSARPTAPAALRMRVREITGPERAASSPARERIRLPLRRVSLVAVPAALALAVVTAGAVGLSRSGQTEAFRDSLAVDSGNAEAVPEGAVGSESAPPGTSTPSTTADRAQRISATLTLEVADADAVSRTAQSALDLTRRLGGYVVSSSVATGEEGSAQLVVRVPVAKVQDAIVGLSGLGRIVSQQVTVDDLQEQLDALAVREASLTAQIARIRARLATGNLEPQAEAVLRARLLSLREELTKVRGESAATSAEARMATISLAVVTPGALGVVPVPSRLDRTLDEALNVLLWEGVIALAVAIVLAPLALVVGTAWLGHRLYRRREDERLLAAS